ncbi:hypothetical protein TNCV_657111 [Trichonephila clavipes]|nr:hypothetical protein TNCV_657111 [Trichonephila clavipes]
MICVVRSSTVVSRIGHTSNFLYHQKEKSKGLRSGECGEQAIGQKCSFCLLRYIVSWCSPFLTTQSKMCWYTIVYEPFVLVRSGRYSLINSGKSGKFAYEQVSSTLPWRSKSLHSFTNSSRLAPCPPDGYYYPDFFRLNVVCEPMLVGDLPALCCLL